MIRTSSGWFDSTVEPSELVVKGVCDVHNAEFVASMVTCYLSLFADSPLRQRRGRRTSNREFFGCRKFLTARPIRETVVILADLADRLSKASHLTGGATITGDFIPDMRSVPVFEEYLAWYNTGDTKLYQFLQSFLRFAKKAHYEDPELHAAALATWKETEQRLRTVVLPPETVRDLRTVMAAVLPPFGNDLWPKFGPGNVAETWIRDRLAKAGNFRYDASISRAFLKPNIFNGEPPDLHRVIPDVELWEKGEVDRKIRAEKIGREKEVHKNAKTARTITMEPNPRMAFQQCLLGRLTDAIENGLLAPFVRLNDQRENQLGALHGSATGSVDTLDLSNASDSVLWELVKSVFPRDYVYSLAATRTRTVRLTTGETVDVLKFAPMGSAVCFPVQCIVFASCIVLAMMRVDDRELFNSPLGLTVGRVQEFLRTRVGRRYDTRHSYGRRFETFRVYGDDLICDYRVTDEVIELLTSLGFVVNTGKSFTGSDALRESCGVFAFNGEDVTPITHSVKHHGSRLDIAAMCSYVASANKAGDAGYVHLQRAYTQKALYSDIGVVAKMTLTKARRSDAQQSKTRVRDEREGLVWAKTSKNPILFTNDRNEPGIYVTGRPRNEHLPWCYNRSLQRGEVLSVWAQEVHSGCVPFEHPLESYLYSQWLGSHRFGQTKAERSAGPHLKPGETRPLWRWTPTGG